MKTVVDLIWRCEGVVRALCWRRQVDLQSYHEVATTVFARPPPLQCCGRTTTGRLHDAGLNGNEIMTIYKFTHHYFTTTNGKLFSYICVVTSGKGLHEVSEKGKPDCRAFVAGWIMDGSGYCIPIGTTDVYGSKRAETLMIRFRSRYLRYSNTGVASNKGIMLERFRLGQAHRGGGHACTVHQRNQTGPNDEDLLR